MSARQDDAAVVAAMVRAFDFPRYAAALFAPAPQRRALLALAGFALEIGRIPDQVTQPLPGEVRLRWWSDALQGTEHGGIAGHPVAAELLGAIEAHIPDRAALLALIAAHRFDLYDDAIPNMAALDIYCDDTDGSLIRAAVEVLTPGPDAEDAVRAAGRAIGLTRILMRLAHDAARRRCFLPNDWMADHGLTRGAVLAGQETDEIRAVRGEMIGAARDSLARARAAVTPLPKRLRPAFLPLATLRYDLDALAGSPPFAPNAPPSRLRVLVSQWRMMR